MKIDALVEWNRDYPTCGIKTGLSETYILDLDYIDSEEDLQSAVLDTVFERRGRKNGIGFDWNDFSVLNGQDIMCAV